MRQERFTKRVSALRAVAPVLVVALGGALMLWGPEAIDDPLRFDGPLTVRGTRLTGNPSLHGAVAVFGGIGIENFGGSRVVLEGVEIAGDAKVVGVAILMFEDVPPDGIGYGGGCGPFPHPDFEGAVPIAGFTLDSRDRAVLYVGLDGSHVGITTSLTLRYRMRGRARSVSTYYAVGVIDARPMPCDDWPRPRSSPAADPDFAIG